MLSRLDLRGADADPRAVLAATADSDEEPVAAVRDIIARVRRDGDRALRALTQDLDGATIDDLRVAPAECATALHGLDPELRAALELAAGRITAYHRAQAEVPEPGGIDVDGVSVVEHTVPVDRVGLYVPGGRAAYPSTVLMTAIPARCAGVTEIALCVPPAPDGSVPAVTLAAAALAEVGEIYRVGGAQAIAAMAYGTETIRPVDLIVGPGNVYVSVAKQEVAADGAVGIDAPAGPSELVVIADATAPADWVAADLLAQAEHGPGGTAIVIAWDEDVCNSVAVAVDEAVASSARRDEIRASLSTGGRAVLARDAKHAVEIANAVAPEHLELCVADPAALLPLVRNAGAVFCGVDTPTALGDYVAGSNHVLPTGRAARFAGALRVDDFRKHVHVVTATGEGVTKIGAAGAVIARGEGLEEHARSLELRARR
ncbi:MAG TPA: histidinol dehydrogenase [Acidimicrobiia bacterium]|jgi:histidinol dehydrogenase